MRYKFVPVPGKPYCFTAVDKVTGQPFNVAQALADEFNRRGDANNA